jgi:hypothetical protein
LGVPAADEIVINSNAIKVTSAPGFMPRKMWKSFSLLDRFSPSRAFE